MNYGYFDEVNKEYVITRPDTPAPWANYLGSPAYGAIISNNAGGYSFVKSGANGRILRYVFNQFDEPGRYIEEFAKCGADNITVHAECCTHLNRVLKEIKDLGLSASVALNPATPLNVLDYVMNYIDMVLIMTVNPGFGGQAYIEESTEKIRSLKDKIQSGGRNIRIEVDGGINDETLPIVLDAGANVIVAGTSIFKGNIEENVLKFQSVMNK